MTSAASASRSGLKTRAIGAGLQRLRLWWVEEFFALFPERIASLLRGRAAPILTLAPYADSEVIKLTSGDRTLATASFEAGQLSLERFLGAQKLTRTETLLRLELPPGKFFARSFDIPAAALATVERLCSVEIERKTPFGPNDVLHGHRIEKLDGGAKLRIQQSIIRRDFVEQELQKFDRTLEDIHFVDTPRSSLATPPAIALKRQERGGRKAATAIKLLCALASLLLIVDFAATYWQQERELARLQTQVASTKARATSIRSHADQLAHEQKILAALRSHRAGSYSLVQLMDEVTRLLPNDAWLNEFRLSEGKSGEPLISITGYATAAANLVDLVDSSPLFKEAALTAPIIPDASVQRERFSLQAKVVLSERASRVATR